MFQQVDISIASADVTPEESLSLAVAAAVSGEQCLLQQS